MTAHNDAPVLLSYRELLTPIINYRPSIIIIIIIINIIITLYLFFFFLILRL